MYERSDVYLAKVPEYRPLYLPILNLLHSFVETWKFRRGHVGGPGSALTHWPAFLHIIL